MDDYSAISLTESKNEWVVRLVNLLTPCIIKGLKELFKESWELCIENDEDAKYLMTFQNFLGRIPKWNNEIIKQEVDRIVSESTCQYLEDLITCVHIIQLKALSCMRVGKHQKKVDIDSPSLNDFIHQVYIQVARKVYTNIYLFEKDILPLEIQKNNRELELIIKECIMNAIRENIPIEKLLRAYMDETEEVDVIEEIKEEIIPLDTKANIIKEGAEGIKQDVKDDNKTPVAVKKPDVVKPLLIEKSLSPAVVPPVVTPNSPVVITTPVGSATASPTAIVPAVIDYVPISQAAVVPAAVVPAAIPEINVKTDVVENPGLGIPSSIRKERAGGVHFSDNDNVIDTEGSESVVNAPKSINRLEQISHENNERRKLEEAEEEGGEEDIIKIGDNIQLNLTEINDLTKAAAVNPPPSLDIEVLS